MFWNGNTISKRLFLSFSILALNVIIISVIAWHFILRNKEIYGVSRRIEYQRIQIVRLLKLDLDFLRFETINQEFYKTNKSAIVSRRDSLSARITLENRGLRDDMLGVSMGIKDRFIAIDSTLEKYNGTFETIKAKIRERGFKDYGKEGKMRQYAHELEKHSKEINIVDVLTLRRHEKDYILRKEKIYYRQLNTLAEQMIHKANDDEGENNFLIYLVKSYRDKFNEVAAIDETIGLTPTQGLLGELNTLSTLLSEQLETLVKVSDEGADRTMRQGILAFLLMAGASIFISFTLTYFTVQRLTRPLKKLSATMGKYMVSQGLNEADLNDNTVTNEISSLSGAFIKLSRQLKVQFDEIQKNSRLLEKKNKDLHNLNEELDRFIYSSAHDLKSPLASIEGLVNLARKEINDPRHNHYFEKMKSSILKMEGFIKDITDYAKNKRQQIKAEKIIIQATIEDIFQSLQYIPQTERILKIVNTDKADFFTDRARLEIILKNLISNAIRYADFNKTDPFIKITVAAVHQNVSIRLEDNGIGIADQHLHKIFDMFYRATDVAKGSGIGLFLVRESVKMLRGTVTVQSELGKGTTFILNLPNLMMVNVNHLPESEPIKFQTA